MTESPYVIERGQGLCHIRLKADPVGRCLGCVRADVLAVIETMVRQETLREVREMLAKRQQQGQEARL
jgi:hypothetical protein